MRDLLRAPHARFPLARNYKTQRIPRHTLADRIVARLQVRVELDAEAHLAPARRGLADGELVQLGPGFQVLGLLVLPDDGDAEARDEREVGVPRLGVVLDAEGKEGRARGSAQLPDGLVGVRIEASALGGGECWVFNPELEFAVGADGGYEVGVDGCREPLYLGFVSSSASLG